MLPDSEAVRLQLGRSPRGRWNVARRCACGCPMVIETMPTLDDGTPFPTTWWLSCKDLCAAVSRLESDGMISEVNELLAADSSLRAALAEATAAYVSKRDAMFRLGREEHPGGGPERVKCLHAHVADRLVNGTNPVGQMVLRRLAWQEPDRPCVTQESV